ncbi:hypothetical protein Trydic_g19384 [Trypoxylus dichotomus]
MLPGSLFWTLLALSNAIKVPSSWKDEQAFLPYYLVVDGLPSAQNVESYYPISAPSNDARDQVVQNDIVVKLLHKMNPHLQILQPQVLNDPPKQNFQPLPIDESVIHVDIKKNPKKLKEESQNADESQENRAEKKETAQAIEEINHEDPGEIPTRPIYPGEGQWVRRGIKHTPHVTKNVFKDSPKESQRSTPGTEFYYSQKHKFQKQFDEFPKKHGLNPSSKSTYKDGDYEETDAKEEFEPYRTYAQVRRTVSKKHLPRKKKTDPRLRESIKDSKIHTVYTEEGYEDSAYDHGDLLKKAESQESQKGSQNVAREDEEFDFPEPPPPSDEDEENFDEDEEESEDTGDDSQKEPKTNQTSHGKDQGEDESDSESKADVIVQFDSKKTQVKKPTYHNEQEIIDSMMDESKYGKKIAPNANKIAQKSFTMLSKSRKRRSLQIDAKKYPHYASKEVDPLSSLRYAENSENIPKKSIGSMSFYRRADKIECPELTDVDPLPETVKNTESSNSSEITTPNPKLGKIGDQIDCLKARYFGHDPLDNPLFKEESVEEPSTFFKLDNDEELGQTNDIYYDQANDYEREGKHLENTTEEPLPEAQPYIVVKRIYRRPPNKHFKRNKVYFNKNGHQIQRQRPKIPTQRLPSNGMEFGGYSSNSERISEVHYKDEIKPSEQMNVFADIINNIKNSTRDPGTDSSEVKPVSIMVNVIKKPQRNGYNRLRVTTNAPLEDEINEEAGDLTKVRHRSSTAKPSSGNRYANEIPNGRYKKRRRRPQITTEIIAMITTESARVKKKRIRPEYPEVVEDPDQFTEENPINTINMNGFKPMTVKDDHTQSNHKPDYQEIETSSINKFLVVGMRPPPERPHMHSNYYLTNQLKHRRASQPPTPLRKRFVRSTNRRGYSEIQRGSRGRQNIQTTTEKIVPEEPEEDDYVPHRSRNFHYDEKTGKIVYDKQPELEATKEEEEIEYEYVEVEEPTHPPPKEKKQEPKRVWPSTFPDGPNYLDFIKKLKEDPNYVLIMDPTEKPSTEASVETSSVSETAIVEDEGPKGLPEYLSILSKVKSDKDYKVIEDPTKKPKSTTPVTLEEEEELVEDILEDVQNSPGAQSRGDSSRNLESLADSDSETKTRNYNPRTSIDTSKYKSIQRSSPTTRHSISSRYNSEDSFKDQDEPNMDQVESKLVASGIEPLPTTTKESFTIDIPTTPIPATVPVRSTTTATGRSRRILVNRRRGTTTPIPSSTAGTVTTATRRSNRGRNRFTVSTTEAPKEESTRNRRYLQRRHQYNLVVPKNHKPQYTEAGTLPSVQNIKPTPRSISLELLKQTKSINNGSKTDNNNKTKLDDVEVFKDYDKTKKHGGNYKYKKVQIKITRNYDPYSKDGGEIEGLNEDVAPKPFSYYTDSKLPLKINQLKERSDDVDTSFFDEANDQNGAEYFEENQDAKPRVKKQDIPVFIKDPSKRLYYYAPV